MTALHQAVEEYLEIRRALGYKLERHEKLLAQFVDYLNEIAATTVTVEHAMAWATSPIGVTTLWWRARLSVVRGFATWLAAFDPATEIPPTDLLPCPRQRGPHLEELKVNDVKGGGSVPLLSNGCYSSVSWCNSDQCRGTCHQLG